MWSKSNRITIYQSQTDKALMFSQNYWGFGSRLGQVNLSKMSFYGDTVNATNAYSELSLLEKLTETGHDYFAKKLIGDIGQIIRNDQHPKKRGLSPQLNKNGDTYWVVPAS